MLTVSMFGPMRIALDGIPLTLAASPKVGALLAYVLLHRPDRIPRPNIAFALWPDSIESDARASLRRHLYMLAQALPPTSGEPWLSIDTRTVAWNPNAAVSVDVERFEKASLEEARLHEAVEVYAGELLEGLEDEWIVAERERFSQRHGENLGRLIKRASSRGEILPAIGYAQAALRLDPYSEEAARALMRLSHASGKRSSALVEFERFSARLRDELGVEPMPETSALYQSILENVPVDEAAVGSRAPDDTATQPALPFVGRESALETLNEAWSRAKQGRGSVVLVGGEAGVGKTRLTQQFVTAAKIDAGAVLRGETTFIETTPYQAIIEALRSAATDPRLAQVESFWLATMDAREAAPLDALAERRRLFESIATHLESLAAVRPLLLVLEDVHWAGDATIALLEYIGRRVAHSRIVAVATYREEEVIRSHPVREMQRRLRAEQRLIKIALGPLTHSEVAKLVASSSDAPVAGSPEAESYFRISEGHPLFLSELLREGRSAIDTLPSSLEDAIRRRFADLPEASRTLAELAAVIGRGFDVELLREVSGWSEHDVLEHLDDLIARQIVREMPGANRHYGYNFRHHLFQTFAYDRVGNANREHRHLRVARSIEALYADRLHELAPELAYHYARAERREVASNFYAIAARGALDVYAGEDAVSYVGCALALEPPENIELELLLLREEAYRRLGKRDEQLSDVARALMLAERSGNPDLLCEALERHIAAAHAAGDRDVESRAIDRLFTCTHGAAPRRYAVAQKLSGLLYLVTGRFVQAREALDAATASFEGIGDVAGSLESQLSKVTLYRVDGETDKAHELLLRLERELEGKDESRFLMAQVLEQQARVLSHRKRFDEMRAVGKRLLTFCEQIGYLEGEARAYQFLGVASSWTFDIVAARRYLDEAFGLFEILGNRNGQFAVTIDFGMLALWIGRLDEALASFETAFALANQTGDAYGAVTSLMNTSYVYIVSERFDEARATAIRAVDGCKKLDARKLLATALVNLGIAARDSGDRKMALAVLAEAVETAREQRLDDERIEALAHLAFTAALEGDLATSRGWLENMPYLAREAEIAERLPMNALVAAAFAYHHAGQTELARDLFARCHDIYLKRLSIIEDKQSRAAFTALPHHRTIVRAVEESLEEVVNGRFQDAVPVR